MTDQPYLRLRGIRKEFGAFAALSNIDLDIARGEFVCFLGPSGCGKTTLLRIIAGLEVPTSGTISQAGKDITRKPPAERDYGIVFYTIASRSSSRSVSTTQPESARGFLPPN